jgi:hypothetical protein
VPILSYVNDRDGGPLSITGSYTLNGGSSINLPAPSLFTYTAGQALFVYSKQASDVGTYKITLYAEDELKSKSTACEFNIVISNTLPILLTSIPNDSMINRDKKTINLT